MLHMDNAHRIVRWALSLFVEVGGENEAFQIDYIGYLMLVRGNGVCVGSDGRKIGRRV